MRQILLMDHRNKDGMVTFICGLILLTGNIGNTLFNYLTTGDFKVETTSFSKGERNMEGLEMLCDSCNTLPYPGLSWAEFR